MNDVTRLMYSLSASVSSGLYLSRPGVSEFTIIYGEKMEG